MNDIVRMQYDRLTWHVTTQDTEDVQSYFMPKEQALKALWATGYAYVLAADVDGIKADLQRAASNATVSYEGKFGRNCPYCEFVALNARDYFQHLADVETKHVLTGAARRDVPYRGMVAMAEARLQNRYAIEERRRQDALKQGVQ